MDERRTNKRISILDRPDVVDAIDAIINSGNVCEVKLEGEEQEPAVVEIYRKVKIRRRKSGAISK